METSCYEKCKHILIRFILVIAVIVLCLLLAKDSLFWKDDLHNELIGLSVEDFKVTVLDEETIRLENLIKGEELSYSWLITNYNEGKILKSGERLEIDENDIIEFTYSYLDRVEFQAVVEFDGMIYTSDTFLLNEDGTISLLLDVDDVDEQSTVTETTEITRDISDIVSISYLCFLVIVAVLYYTIFSRKQWLVLMIASIIFYLLSGVQYIIFIVTSSYMTFYMAKLMSINTTKYEEKIKELTNKKEKKQHKLLLQRDNKVLLGCALIATLGVMVVIKYTDFLIANINSLLHTEIAFLTLIMPLGLSFYTFMLIAYLFDVYRGKYVAEIKYLKFFTYISFFPHIAQGPLSRYDDISPQIRERHRFSYENLCQSSQRILWGFFVKLVIADRIAILVNGIYKDYTIQSWLMLLLASCAYSIQIYADFYSSMEIAIGTAQLFGIKLTENFLRPYFSTSMPEFWRRWHATLGTWFKDYVFYPISISKKLMKFSVNTRKKYGPDVARVLSAAPPIMGVWILTGLWHGASWNFVAWGIFHGTLILLSTAFAQNVKSGVERIGINTNAKYYKLMQMSKVFILCTIGRIFFRTSSLAEAKAVMGSILTLSVPNLLVDFSEIDFNLEDTIVIIVALLLFLIVSTLQERGNKVREIISTKHIVIRWSIWLFIIFTTVIFGVYGLGTSSVFLYEAF
ncbi:MAG: MBOAT family O-acyltransferase [Eubacteriales bacterium]